MHNHGVFNSLLPTPWGICVCPRAHVYLRGHVPQSVLTAQPPVQQKRTVFIRKGLINERTICAQSESFCFGKASSFRQGRVGTRKQLKTLENEEVRGRESGRNGVAKGHTAAWPLISQPHQSLGLPSFA